jgi:dTDP-4-dehydrorhamnose 3,5-epimerase
MRFIPTELAGAWLIELELRHDARGYFARTFCEQEFAGQGLVSRFVQCNVAWNKAAGTLRGLHYQAAPHAETKVVRCTRGALYDVIVDLRPGSPTRGKWVAVELAPMNGLMLYVPEGFAHGYQTLEPDTEVSYLMSALPVPEAERGLRWDDPALAIRWPLPSPILSDRDRSHPPFQP